MEVDAVEREGHERATRTVEEAAEILGIGRSAAYAAVARGELPALRIGRRLVVPSEALDRLLRGDKMQSAV
jgi:excisionase family DNA binding protein